MPRVEYNNPKDIKSYKDLVAWQKAMQLVTDIYNITKSFPKEEIYGITNQLRRCSISIPSNLAEGSSRRSTQEFIRFINISCGSLAELETQIIASKNLGYITHEQEKHISDKTDELSRILQGLYNSLDSRLKPLDS